MHIMMLKKIKKSMTFDLTESFPRKMLEESTLEESTLEQLRG